MKQIKEDIKNRSFHQTYLFFGEEGYLKKMYRDRLKSALLEDSDEMNFTRFDGKELDLNELQEIGNTLPFFSDYRMILVEDSGLFKKASEVTDVLEQMPESTIVLFVEKEVDKRNKLYKYINKKGLAVSMDSMTIIELKSWLTLLLRDSHRQMREKTAQYLLERIDNSMSNVQNEMEKLIAYTQGKEEITIQDVDEVCCVQVTGHIFQMMDAVGSENQQETLRLYHELLELRESPMSILFLLNRHFNILLQVKSLEKSGKSEIAKKVGIPPFAVGKYQSQCRHFSEETLVAMLESCIQTEYEFKRGLLDDRMGVELLLVSLSGGMLQKE